MFADVIIDITHENLDKVFQYSIPSEMEGMLRVGMQVIVPFGKGNRRTKGYLIRFSEEADYPVQKIKSILEIVPDDPAIEGKLLGLAAWMKDVYGGTMAQALRTVLPVKHSVRERKKRTLRLMMSPEDAEEKLAYYEKKNQKARARLLRVLIEKQEIDYDTAVKEHGAARPVIQALAEQDVLIIEEERKYRRAVSGLDMQQERKALLPMQKQCAGQVISDYRNGIRKTYLLHGITGSGKTEVYLEIMEEVIRQGGQVIFLIPEISLTWQMVQRFYSRFGSRLAIMNSRLSAGERYDQMQLAREGKIDVMIGPRSALFTPFPNLGLIVIDEEHEPSYKSEQVPSFHARETAVERSRLEHASVVLGSATPSMESFYRAKRGEYTLLTLSERAGGGELPEIYVEDMRKELKNGNSSMFSDRLKELMEERLRRHEQILLFLNRRGYAGFVCCRSCGYVVKCSHCDVAMSEHTGGRLVCHYCGAVSNGIRKCPVCGSNHIGGFHAGTQQIERAVSRAFPQARVLRMDADSTRGKEGHDRILASFAAQEADILIGTQMIVKGHDFPNVTLVGVLAADLSLYQSDFRAGERTFELLVQAAGRAGRGQKRGEVVIQTYQPEHYSIRTAAAQDYEQFYKEEIAYRDLCGYPPVEHMTAVRMECADEELLSQAAYYLAEYAKKAGADKRVQVIGPAAPYVSKVKDVYRQQIFFRHKDMKVLMVLKDRMEKYIDVNSGFARVRVLFDLDPV